MPVKLKRKMKPKRKDYKKKYSTNKGKLMDSKINTIVEKRIQQIAQKEISKKHPSLCLRRYCWIDYDPIENKFRDLATATPIFDWNGQSVNLTEKIVKEDIATMANIPVLDDPSTQQNEAIIRAADGTNILTAIVVRDGRRNGDQIVVTGFSLQCRVLSKYVNLTNGGNLYDNVDVHIALIKARRTRIEGGPEENIDYIPANLLKLNPWGYQSNLDRDDELINKSHKVSTLFRTKITMRQGRENQPNIKFKNYFGKFKKPITINYKPDDINARRQNYDIYLVVRSSVGATGHITDTQSMPYCGICAKLYYTNKN